MSSDFYTNAIVPYAGIIIKICRAYSNSQEDFEDYYQEVCLQIWRSRDSFKGEAQWSTWVYRLSLNVCLSLLRKHKKREGNSLNEHAIPDVTVTEETTFSEASLNHLYNAIKELSVTDRAVIVLYLEQKQYKEIAEIIGVSPNNIGVQINRIKKKLKKILIKNDYYENIN